MKALTIKQPWASLIVHGIKDIENRTWRTKLRERIYVHSSQAWNAEIAKICINNPNVRAALEKLGMMHNYRDESIGYKGYSFSGLECGAIIGEVDIVDCVINHESIWAEKSDFKFSKKPMKQDYYIGGNFVDYNLISYKRDMELFKRQKPIYNWVLANPVLYEKPIPCKGKLSFWQPDL